MPKEPFGEPPIVLNTLWWPPTLSYFLCLWSDLPPAILLWNFDEKERIVLLVLPLDVSFFLESPASCCAFIYINPDIVARQTGSKNWEVMKTCTLKSYTLIPITQNVCSYTEYDFQRRYLFWTYFAPPCEDPLLVKFLANVDVIASGQISLKSLQWFVEVKKKTQKKQTNGR